MKRYFLQAVFDLRCWWRNGEQLLLLVILPTLALVLGTQYGESLGIAPRSLLDGTIVMSYFASAFVGQSIMTAFDRRSNSLVVIGAGPVGTNGFVIARALSVLVTCVVQLFIICAIAWWLDFAVADVVRSGVLAMSGVPAFVALGLLLAGTMRAELVLATSNLLFIGMAVLSGVVNSVPWTPVGAVRLVQAGDALGLIVVLIWTIVAGVTSVRYFRWTD